MSIESFYNTTFVPYTLAPSTTYPYDMVETAGASFLGAIDLMESYAPSSNRKQFEDGKITSVNTFLIVCGAPSPVTLSDRIKTGTRTFTIRAIDTINFKPGHHTEIMVEEVS